MQLRVRLITPLRVPAGGFPFLTTGEEAADPLRKMRHMLPRILAGDYLPLPNPVRVLLPRCKKLGRTPSRRACNVARPEGRLQVPAGSMVWPPHSTQVRRNADDAGHCMVNNTVSRADGEARGAGLADV